MDKHCVEGQPPVRLCNYTDVYKNSAITRDLDFMPASASPEQVKRFRLQIGDTLITKDSETADDIGIPAFVLTEADDLICGYHLAIIRPDPEVAHPKYLHWVLSSEPSFRQWLLLATGVTRVGIKSGDLGRLQIALPPKADQEAIADYLDRETAKTDTLITEQERLISLIGERRQASFDSVLTSGAGWLVQLRRITSVPIEAGVDAQGDSTNPTDWPRYVRTTDIASMFRMHSDRRVTVAPDVAAAARLEAGDLVATRAGATIGKAMLFSGDEPAAFAGYLVRIRLDQNLAIPEYVAYWTASAHYKGQVSSGAVKSTIDNFSAAKYRSLVIPLPSLDRQREICAELDSTIRGLDAIEAEAESFIALARERRSALITAAVTGQIEIPGAA